MQSIHNMTRRILLTIIASAAVLSAVPGARADEPLRWKLQAGEKFDFVMTQDMAMSLTGGPSGQQMNTTMHQQMDMTWDVASISPDGNALINQSIGRVRMTMNAPMGQGFEYDTQSKEPAAGMAAMIAPLYEAMTQGQVEITMSPRGEIRDVKIPEKMIESLKNVPGAASMGDLTTPEGFKKMFMQGSLVLPEGPPTPGEKWNTGMDMNNPMMGKMTVDTTYEYKGTKDVNGSTCAVIEPAVTTKIEGQASVPMTIKDQSSGGEILFNLDQGRLQSSQIKQKMTIDATVGNQSIQQTIDQTINATLTPVEK